MVAMRNHCCDESSSRLELWKIIKKWNGLRQEHLPNAPLHIHSFAGSETKPYRNNRFQLRETTHTDFWQCVLYILYVLDCFQWFCSHEFHWIQEISSAWPSVTHKTDDRAGEIMSRYHQCLCIQWIYGWKTVGFTQTVLRHVHICIGQMVRKKINK